jgi:hypothetical protein
MYQHISAYIDRFIYVHLEFYIEICALNTARVVG